MEQNTLFRIASMSKPITSTVALMLVDEGRFTLEDSIARWAAEFSKMRVLTYGDFATGSISKAYEETLGSDIDSED